MIQVDLKHLVIGLIAMDVGVALCVVGHNMPSAILLSAGVIITLFGIGFLVSGLLGENMDEAKIGSDNYDGTKCPNCESENINGDTIEPAGSSIAYRDCDCNDCGATWTEIHEVTGYDNLTVPEKN